MSTPDEIKRAMTKALEEFDTLDNHELVITPDYMDDIEPASTYKGLFVVLGKEVAVRKRQSTPAKPTINPQDMRGDLMYWFRGRNGVPFAAQERKAWRYLTQNGEWKFTPSYLGAIPEKTYKEQLKDVEKTMSKDRERIAELTVISNTEAERMSGKLQQELGRLIKKQKAALDAFHQEFVKQCDPTVRPKGSHMRVQDLTDASTRGNAESIARGSIGV